MDSVNVSIRPQVKDLGGGFNVRRALPHVDKRFVGPFIFWDHMGPALLNDESEMVVRSHPHIGLATITWLFSGEILHRDSLGNEQVIRPGEVNWMTAGNGIAHSERSIVKGRPTKLEGIQLWLALPVEYEEVDPSFFHCKPIDLPRIQIDGVELRLIAGEAMGKKSPVPVYSKLFYLSGEIELGKKFFMPVDDDSEGAVYIIDGSLDIEGVTYGQNSLVCFKKGGPVAFSALEKSKMMIFGGMPFEEKRKMWWNFVSSRPERIEMAKKAWRERRFHPVINETEYIPLPED